MEMSTGVQTVEAVHYKSWTQQMDEFLLDFLLEQKNQGQKPDRNFSQAAYNVAIEAINSKFTMKVNKDNVQNRLKTLKRKMTIALEVFKRGSGFGWNDITKKIEAPEEVWDELIKVYPDAKHVRNIAIPNFIVLREIFEKDRANGKGAETGKEKTRRWVREGKEPSGGESSRIEDIDRLVAQQQVHLETLEDFEEENFDQMSLPHSSSTTNISKVGKKKLSKFDEMNERFDTLNNTISQMAKAMDVNEQNKRRCEEIYTELTKLEGVDEDFVFAASDFLVSNPNAADLFLGIPLHARRRWLNWKMDNSS
ncbi:uncharacterized protein [Henckelia pumila]|uniref:uncharacterized protein n=1 Tax=Henckelia pumila TaxID=405737 RepID=UPI003C6E0C4B